MSMLISASETVNSVDLDPPKKKKQDVPKNSIFGRFNSLLNIEKRCREPPSSKLDRLKPS